MMLAFRSLFRIRNHVNTMVIQNRGMLKHSINHITNKKVLDRYLRLPLPGHKVLATYIWIDGSGINLRSKDRILNCVPCCPGVTPVWAFDGSSTGQATRDNSDTTLQPVALYRDPFKGDPHILVMCEVYTGDGCPAPTNHRKFCNHLCEIHRDEEPWFGLEQECTFLDVDGWGLGWPKGGGFPAVKYQYSYCGVGAKHVVGRDINEAHKMACLYAGIDFEGSNSEVMFGCWEWQIGTSFGIKAADDLWTSRYIMGRVAEDYGVEVTYHPKPMGSMHPGIGVHHNFSTIRMRSEGGYKYIEECIKKLEANHSKHMEKYGNDECTNRLRLTGKFETPEFDKFSWGVASRKTSIRLQRGVKEKGRGFMEDRRPAGDCDPYLTCGLLLETCLGSKALAPPSKPLSKSPCPCACACTCASTDTKASPTSPGISACLATIPPTATSNNYETFNNYMRPSTSIYLAPLNDTVKSIQPTCKNISAPVFTATNQAKSMFSETSTSISQAKTILPDVTSNSKNIFSDALTNHKTPTATTPSKSSSEVNSPTRPAIKKY